MVLAEQTEEVKEENDREPQGRCSGIAAAGAARERGEHADPLSCWENEAQGQRRAGYIVLMLAARWIHAPSRG
jgi:hypothetical protein